MFRYPSTIAFLILLTVLASFGMASAYGPETTDRSLDRLKTDINSSLDLGNLEVEQTAVTIARDYPGEYNLNQVSEVYDALRKGWYYYSDPSYKDKYKSANRTLQDGKISNSIGMGDCDDFAILMASLLESLQGSIRIVFAYDRDTRLNHAYAEVYLGKKSDPRVEELMSWLKDQYNLAEIPGQAINGEEVWLNLDYNSTHTGGRNYPGGRHFGGQRTEREVVWQSASRRQPKIVPIIETMDSTDGWEKIGDKKGSNVSISSMPSPKRRAIQIEFDLKEGGWAGISRNVSGSILSQVKGLNLSYYGLDKQITLQLMLVYDGGTRFSYTWKPEPGNKWASLEALFEDFTQLDPASRHDSSTQILDPNRVAKLNLIILSELDESAFAGTGRITIDHIRGVMNIPPGSPWARAEEEREIALSKDLAYESEQVRNIPGKFIQSIQLAVESLNHHETFQGDLALRKGSALLPKCLAQFAYEEASYKLAFSPDGLKLGTAGWDRYAMIWDVETGAELYKLNHNASVHSVVFSPDGLKMATASDDNTSRIWDVQTGKEFHELDHDGKVNSVAFSSDGLKLATRSDNTVRIWDVDTGAEIHRLRLDHATSSVAFSSDCSKLATGSDDKIVGIWDIASGKQLQRLECNGPVSIMAFSLDGSKLAIGSNIYEVFNLSSIHESYNVQIWSVANGQLLQRLPYDNPVNTISFSKDGSKLAVGSDDRIAIIWDTVSGQPLKRLENEGSVNTVVFSSDGGKLATGSIYEDVAGMGVSLIYTIRVWNVDSGRLLQKLENENAFAFSPDGRKLATVNDDHTIRIWDLVHGQQLQWLEHNGSVNAVAFSPDGSKVATGSSDDHAVQIWDTSSSKKLLKMQCDGLINIIAFNFDGSELAIGSSDNKGRGPIVQVMDISSGQQLQRSQYGRNIMYSIAFSKDASKLALGTDDTARIWDIKTDRLLHSLEYGGSVMTVSFSPDGRTLATCVSNNSNYDVQIRDLANGNQYITLKHDGSANAIAFSQDGSKLATCSRDGSVRIFDAATGRQLQSLEHYGSVNTIAFSQNGSKLATGCGDGSARIWDLVTRQLLKRFEHNDRVLALAFSPDGGKLATGGADKSARIWTLSSQDLICETCSRLKCNLISPEWLEKYCSKCNASGAYLDG